MRSQRISIHCPTRRTRTPDPRHKPAGPSHHQRSMHLKPAFGPSGPVIYRNRPRTLVRVFARRNEYSSRTVTAAFRTDNSATLKNWSGAFRSAQSPLRARRCPPMSAYLASTPPVAYGSACFQAARRRLVPPPAAPRGSPAARIYNDVVAGPQQADGAADRSLRGNMSHHKAVAAAGEAPVRNERRPCRPGPADDGAGGTEHLAHPGTPARALVADDEHVARRAPPGKDRRVARSSPSNTRAGPSKRSPSLPVILATAPSGARLPYSTTRWLSFLSGCRERPDNVLSGIYGARYPDSPRGSAGDRHALPCSSPPSSSIFMSGWIPPIATSSDIR